MNANGVSLRRHETGRRPIDGIISLVFQPVQGLADLLAGPVAKLRQQIVSTTEGQQYAAAKREADGLTPRLRDLDAKLDDVAGRREELFNHPPASIDEAKRLRSDLDAEFTRLQNERNQIAGELKLALAVLKPLREALLSRFGSGERELRQSLKGELRQRAEKSMDKIEHVLAEPFRELAEILQAESSLFDRELPPSMGGSPPMSAGDLDRMFSS